MIIKKISIIIISLFIISCGPKRLGCGPYRCEINTIQNNE